MLKCAYSSFYSQNIYLNSEPSFLHWKSPATPGDSKTCFNIREKLQCTGQCLMLVHVGSQDQGSGTPSRNLAGTISCNACQLRSLLLVYRAAATAAGEAYSDCASTVLHGSGLKVCSPAPVLLLQHVGGDLPEQGDERACG